MDQRMDRYTFARGCRKSKDGSVGLFGLSFVLVCFSFDLSFSFISEVNMFFECEFVQTLYDRMYVYERW